MNGQRVPFPYSYMNSAQEIRPKGTALRHALSLINLIAY